ncbi:MAG: aldehyde dehydrogenase family protein [Candidatus Asgardarchaeia archaeon]
MFPSIIDILKKYDDIFGEIYEVDDQGIPVFKMFIDGKWTFSETGEYINVKFPYTNEIVSRVPKASINDLEKAIQSANNHKQDIRDVPAIERIEIFQYAKDLLEKTKDLFETVLVWEAGKPISNAKGEIHATSQRLQLTMEEARKIFGEYIPGDWSEGTMQKIAIVLREPLGVVLAISPFNYPLFISSSKIIPALLAGNAVVVKPASADPTAVLLFARLLEKVGLPKGSLNVVTTSGSNAAHLVKHDKIDMITFTGSTETGLWISQNSGVKKRHLELGGKGAAIVLEDADLKLAVKEVVKGAIKFSGQRCDAISRVLVVESIAEEFVKRFVDEVKKWKYGDPRDPSVELGPLIDSSAANRVYSLIQDAIEKGAKLLYGGKRDGNIIEPTVLDEVPLTARIAWEETFGPVVTIIRVKDIDEAIEVANKSDYGLDSSVFTNNLYNAWKVAKKLHDGEITINSHPVHGVGYFPFGGVKKSGLGREGIGYSIDEMTRLKTIVINLAPAKLGKIRRVYGI